MNEYECALTGVVESGAEASSADGLDTLPVGWVKITIARRTYNPKWLMIQQVKEAMIEGLMSQMPADLPEVQRYAVVMQVEAQFHGLEKDTPMYVKDVDDVVYLSDAGEVIETINELRSTLALDTIAPIPSIDEIPEEDEEEDEKPADADKK